MGPVLAAAVEIARRVGALGGPARGVGDGGTGGQRLLDPGGPQRGRAHVRQPNLDLLPAGDGSHGDDRPLVGDADELLIGTAPPGVLGDADRGEQLVLADSGLEQVGEELGSGYASLTSGSDDDEFGVESRTCTEVPAVGVHEGPPRVPRCRICGSATDCRLERTRMLTPGRSSTPCGRHGTDDEMIPSSMPKRLILSGR